MSADFSEKTLYSETAEKIVDRLKRGFKVVGNLPEVSPSLKNYPLYGPQAIAAWRAVESAVNEKGEVEGLSIGTGTRFEPYFYQHCSVDVLAAHGYVPLLWAGSEILTMLRTCHPKMNDGGIHFYGEEIKTNSVIFRVN